MPDTAPRTALARNERRVTGILAAIFGLRMFGLFMILPVFTVLGAELDGATPLLMGVAIGAYGLLQALFQVPFGMLSDRYGRRVLMVVGLLVFAAGGVIAASADSIYGVIAGRAVQGAGAVAAVIMALLADVVSEQQRTRAMAIVGMTVGSAFIVALIIGPALAAWLGLSGLFWLATGLALVGLLMTLLWLPEPQLRSREAQLPWRTRVAGVVRDPLLARMNLGIFILHAVLMATFVTVPGLLQQQLPLAQHSVLYLVVFIASLLVMVPLMIRGERRGLRGAKLVAIVLLLAAQLLLALGHQQLWLLTVALWLFFAGFNLLEALLPSLVGRVAPVGTRGTAMGLYSTLQFLGVFAGAALGGWLLQYQGAGAVFWAAAMLLVPWLLAALTMPPLRRLESRSLPLPPAAALAGWSERVLAVPGVLEAVVFAESGVAMIKIDPAEIDEAALDAAAAQLN